MKASRIGWAWDRKAMQRQGYWVDGGIWPLLRYVREATLADYIFDRAGNYKLWGFSEGWENQE
jgi:hypothetical protein